MGGAGHVTGVGVARRTSKRQGCSMFAKDSDTRVSLEGEGQLRRRQLDWTLGTGWALEVLRTELRAVSRVGLGPPCPIFGARACPSSSISPLTTIFNSSSISSLIAVPIRPRPPIPLNYLITEILFLGASRMAYIRTSLQVAASA